MRLKSVLLGLAFLLVLAQLCVPASAQQEYASKEIAFHRGPAFGFPLILHQTWDPTDAKVACTPDNTECVAVLYEKDAFLGYVRGLKLFHSKGTSSNTQHFTGLSLSCDGFIDTFFHGCHPVSVPATWNVDYQADDIYVFGITETYPYPYDVTYNPDDEKFYIVFSTGTQTRTQHSSVYIYRYDRDFTTPVLTGSYSSGSYSYGFDMNVNGTSFMMSDCCIEVPPSSLNQYGRTYLSDFSGTPVPAGIVMTFVGNALVSCGGPTVIRAFGFSAGSNLQYNVTFSTRITSFGDTFPCNSGTIYTGSDENIASSFSRSGWFYHDGNYLYYPDGNVTYRLLSDGVSYGVPQTVYSWLSGEIYNHSSSAVTQSNQLFTFDRSYSGGSGIYVTNRVLYQFRVQAKGVNPLTGVPEDVATTAQIICLAENYTYSGGGVNALLTTPCQTGNSVMLTPSTDWQPSSVIINGVSSLAPSGSTYFKSPPDGFGFVRKYNFTLRFVDQFSGLPVPGASVTVAGVNRTTNSNGEAVFFLQPYGSSTFTVSYIGSTYYMYLNGTPQTYDYFVTAPGHSSASGTFTLTDNQEPTTVGDFRTSKTVQLSPYQTHFVVDVFTSDGVHYTGDSVIVRIGGTNGAIYYDANGLLVLRSYASAFPATFTLLDNRSSWVLYTNLTEGATFLSHNLTIVNTTTLYSYTYTLPETSANLQCTSDLGCADTFCVGGAWNSGGHCVAGTCVYGQQACPLFCDDSAGCYSDVTVTSCPTGFDFECYGSNVCADSAHLKSYKCSAGHTCVYEIVTCGYACQDGVCLSAPVVALCDQSTVVGMLTCMQSGVMGFIGTTYGPLMAIGIVIFIVVIVTLLLGIGFKAIGSTLR